MSFQQHRRRCSVRAPKSRVEACANTCFNFDLHHGNGTQKAFYTSSEVLFISTHQWPYYPGTGGLKEIGKDAGRGFTLNVPLSGGTGDEECVQVFRKIVGPVGREFSPDLVLVSAGFDAHKKDPLGTLQLTPSGYAALTKEILDIAHDVCGGRAVFSSRGDITWRGSRSRLRGSWR